MKGVLACALFLFLQGCTKTFTWEMDAVRTRCHEFDSARIRSVKRPGSCGLDLEMVRSGECERVYVNIHGLPLPPEPVKTVHVTIADQTYDIQAYLLEGGQRLLLDEEGAQLILDSLWDEQGVGISVGPYSKQFESDNFPELYSTIE